jgi:hypothetical protein
MTPHQILIVALRVGAVLWFLHALSHAATTVTLATDPDVESTHALLIFSFAALELIACIFMWAFPATIAAWLLPSGGTKSAVPGPSLPEWQTLGVILVGLLVLAEAIPGAVYWIVDVATLNRPFSIQDYFSSYFAASTISTAVKLIIGFWLLLGGRGIAAVLFRIRTAGLRS